jgi:hypothetical protein
MISIKYSCTSLSRLFFPGAREEELVPRVRRSFLDSQLSVVDDLVMPKRAAASEAPPGESGMDGVSDRDASDGGGRRDGTSVEASSSIGRRSNGESADSLESSGVFEVQLVKFDFLVQP